MDILAWSSCTAMSAKLSRPNDAKSGELSAGIGTLK